MITSFKDLSFAQQQKVERELDRGEQVLWTGAPKPRFFRRSNLGTFLFGIPWTGFAIFWVAMAASMIWDVRSHLPQHMLDIYRTDHADGTGDIVSDGQFHLEGVQDPILVEELIQKLAEPFIGSSYNEEKF